MASREESATFQSVRVSENVELLASGTSSFALELYKQLTKRSTGNVFLSPLSISTVLSMAYVGARGNTAVELKKAMFLEGLEDLRLQQAFADIRRYLNDVINRHYSDEPLFQVCMENRLFAEKSYPFLEAFQTSCRQYHDAESANVDFIGNPSNAAEEINTWVSENTKGKISEIISSDDINSSTRLVLLDAIYFKSAWNDQFEPHNTQEADFHVSSTETTKVQLMFRKVKDAAYSLSEDLGCQILKITYLNDALSMFILLPDKSSLDELEGKLTADHLNSIDDVLGISSGLQFWLPKFKLEAQMELPDVLRDIGIKDLFDEGAADLSGMDNTRLLYASKVVHKAYVDVNEEGTETGGATSVTFKIKAQMELTDVLRDIGIKDLLDEGAADLSGMDNTRLLYASKVVHKAYVDVNEEGTEAAGATSMTIEARCGSFSPGPVEFRADHPFLFFIREDFAKVIIFLGRVVKPQSTS